MIPPTKDTEKMSPYEPLQHQNQTDCQWTKLRYDNLHVLLVDDDDVIRFIMKEILELQGVTIYEAENGQEAIDIFDKTSLDIILMDLNMPVMNGFEAIAIIRERLQDKFIPIITVNAFDNDKILQQALNCGADDYLVKPVDNDVLISKINSMLRIKELYDKEHDLRIRLYAENQKSNQLSEELKKAKRDLEKNNYQLTIVNQQLDRYGRELENEVIKKTNLLRQKDLQLLEKDREVSLYTLASGMAHEINNPLGFIKSSVVSLGKRMNRLLDHSLNTNLDNAAIIKERQATERILKRAYKGIERIMDVIGYFKRFSNVDMEKSGPLDLNLSITDNIRLIETIKTINHPFIKTDLGDIPEIICTRQEVNICIFNVLKNAVDAINAKQAYDTEFINGQIEIVTRYKVPPPCVVVEIKDNGIGMTDDEIRHSFDPFYTQKPVGEGSGIGLTMADAYMKKNYGSITMTSEKNKGTTVTLTFLIQEKQNKTGDKNDRN